MRVIDILFGIVLIAGLVLSLPVVEPIVAGWKRLSARTRSSGVDLEGLPSDSEVPRGA